MSERISISLITFGILVIFTSVYLGKEKSKTLISEFRTGTVLVCFNTLIVSNSNWSLVEDHLINNNSAGFVNINKCEIKQ